MADASPPPAADVATPAEARLQAAVRAGREAGAFDRLEAVWLARGAFTLLAGLYRERAAAAARLPRRLELLARLAELLEEELADPGGAAAVYGEMAQVGDEEALEEQLRLLRARGDRTGTWRALDLAVERARARQARCQALVRRGQAALEAGELAAARADFAAVLSLEPGQLDALSGLARLLPEEEPPAPLCALETALLQAQASPSRDERWRELARLADARPDCAELSLRSWRALAVSQPEDAEATERLTALLSGAGSEAELVPVLRARICRVPRGEGARSLRQVLVQALDALGREAEALEALRDAVRAEPGNHEAWLELSDRAEAAGRYAEYAWALEHAATSTVEPAARARLWRRLGAFLGRVPGKQDEARACLDRADRLERAVRTGASALGPLVRPPRPRAGQGEQPPLRADTEVSSPAPPEDRIPTAPRPPPPAPPSVFVDLTPLAPRRGAPDVTPVRPLPERLAPGAPAVMPDLAVGPESTPIRPFPPLPPEGAADAPPTGSLSVSEPTPLSAGGLVEVTPVAPRPAAGPVAPVPGGMGEVPGGPTPGAGADFTPVASRPPGPWSVPEGGGAGELPGSVTLGGSADFTPVASRPPGRSPVPGGGGAGELPAGVTGRGGTQSPPGDGAAFASVTAQPGGGGEMAPGAARHPASPSWTDFTPQTPSAGADFTHVVSRPPGRFSAAAAPGVGEVRGGPGEGGATPAVPPGPDVTPVRPAPVARTPLEGAPGLGLTPLEGWAARAAADRIPTDPGLLPVPGAPPGGERPPVEVPTDPGLAPSQGLLLDARRGERPDADVPTVAPVAEPREPELPRRLLEAAGWHAHAEARGRAGDAWLAAVSREVALALEGVGGPSPEAPRWLLGAWERAQLLPGELGGPLAELLSSCGAALVAAAHADGLPPPAAPFTPGLGPGAPAVLEALAASVRLLGIPAPAPECVAHAGPPFALAAGPGTATRLQVGSLALQRVLPGGELRFFAGRALFTQQPLLRVLRLVPPEELEAWLGVLPEAARGGRRLSREARALRAHLPDALREQAWDALDELDDASTVLDDLAMAARHAANRAGLAACGSVGAAVLSLRSKRALDEEVEALLRFAASGGWRALSAPWTPVSAPPAGGR